MFSILREQPANISNDKSRDGEKRTWEETVFTHVRKKFKISYLNYTRPTRNYGVIESRVVNTSSESIVRILFKEVRKRKVSGKCPELGASLSGIRHTYCIKLFLSVGICREWIHQLQLISKVFNESWKCQSYFVSCYFDHRGTGPLKTTMDVIDAAKVSNSVLGELHWVLITGDFCLFFILQRIAKAGRKMNEKATEIAQRVSS